MSAIAGALRQRAREADRPTWRTVSSIRGNALSVGPIIDWLVERLGARV